MKKFQNIAAEYKTTSQVQDAPTIRFRTSRLRQFLAASVFTWMVGGPFAPLQAIELQVMVANDPVFGNQQADDRYTAALALAIEQKDQRFAFGERMFTDRRAGQRFDETYLTGERTLAPVGDWDLQLGLGVLRIGEGLLGQHVQNEIHEAIGSDILDLAYPSKTHYYGEVSSALERRDFFTNGNLLKTRIEVRSAPGFRSWLRATTSFEAALGKSAAWRIGVGLHAEDANFRLLEANVDPWGATGELALAWRGMTLRYSYNDLGTGTSHLTLGIDMPLERIIVRSGDAGR